MWPICLDPPLFANYILVSYSPPLFARRALQSYLPAHQFFLCGCYHLSSCVIYFTIMFLATAFPCSLLPWKIVFRFVHILCYLFCCIYISLTVLVCLIFFSIYMNGGLGFFGLFLFNFSSFCLPWSDGTGIYYLGFLNIIESLCSASETNTTV